MLTPRSHRLTDYLTVAVFAVAPFALGLGRAATIVCGVLAVAHLALTVLTRFPIPSADTRPLSLQGHGALEITVALVLLMVPWVVPVFSTTARLFLAVMGVLIALGWKLTPYQAADDAAAAGPVEGEPRDPQPPPRP